MAKQLKSFFARMFESKWTYSTDLSTRTHKETGEIQYAWVDDWGTSYTSEPM
jgi:hypothetical protein